MQNASSGTATRASPKPNADRISVAMNMIDKTRRVVVLIAISGGEIRHRFSHSGRQRTFG
jgi:hypothetical protein